MDLSRAHATIGVEPITPIDEVRARYRMRAQMLHPDRLGDRPGLLDEAQRAMAELNAAWEVISSAERAGTRASGAVRESDDNRGADGTRYPVEGECDLCGSAPATRLRLRSTTGMVLTRRDLRIEPDLCRRCGISMFREVQSDTLTKGWWGLTAAFVNVGNVLGNVSEIRRHRFLLREPDHRDPQVLTPLPPGLPLAKPLARRPAPIVSTGAFALAIAAVFSLGATSAPTEVTPSDPGSETPTNQRGETEVGICLNGDGAVTGCAGSFARYQITGKVLDAAECGYLEVFSSTDGGIYCARLLP